MYLLLGCGDVGFAVASQLKRREVELVVVDKEESKVEDLRRFGYKALLGDFTKPEVLKQAEIHRADAVLILVRDFQVVSQTLEVINSLKEELGINPLVVARASDEAEAHELKSLGATEAIASTQILADFALKEFERLRMMKREQELRELLKRLKGKMAVVLQTNPDPDGIASALALKVYARNFGVDSDIIYDGQISHQQNRAMVNLLDLNLLHVEKDGVRFEDYGSFALVDVSSPANCCLPRHLEPTIIIDHHMASASEAKARFKEISPVGATSTILTNYLDYAGIELERPVATALALGILTDTANFTRGATPQDFSAFERLLERMDKDLLGRLQSPAISPAALEVLAKAIRGSKLRGGYLIANVGWVEDRDAIPQAADFLLNREGVMTTLVYGVLKDLVYVSARTSDIRLHLGQAFKEAFGKLGSAGGHASMAGAAIPLRVITKASDRRLVKAAVDKAVGRRFLEIMGVVKPRAKRR